MGREPNGQDRTATVKEQDISSSEPEPQRTKKREKAGDQDGKISGKALGRTVEAFMRLPGIGRKSAERLAFAVLGMPKEEAAGIAQAILDLKNSSRYCSACNNITEEEICGICRDEKRDRTMICVVEEPSNILVLEKTGTFRGRYHALLGALSSIIGLYLSYYIDVVSGAAIVLTATVFFLFAFLFGPRQRVWRRGSSL